MVSCRKLVCTLLALSALGVVPALADITVYWSPGNCPQVPVGNQITMDLYADIPEADAVVGYGLDLYLTRPRSRSRLSALARRGQPLRQSIRIRMMPAWTSTSPPRMNFLATLCSVPACCSRASRSTPCRLA